jgi:hypothetical protein
MRAWLVIGVGLFLSSFVSRVDAQGPALEQRAKLATGAFESATAPVEPTALEPVVPGTPAFEKHPEKKRLWDIVKVLPILFYTPETSVGFGAGSLFQFRMPGASEKGRSSSVALGAVYTLEKQTVAQLTPELRFGDDDYVLRLDLLGAKFPSRFYGIGNEPEQQRYDTFTDCYMRGELDARVRPFRREQVLGSLYLGVHFSAAWSDIHDVRPSEPNQPRMFDAVNDPGERPLFASGLGPSIAWDSRDGLNWPTQGSFIELKATEYAPAFGSEVHYRRLLIDARRYQPLWFSHILALRVVAQSVWGDVPFQRLPQLGGAAMFRGWYTGQLRGPRLIAIEAEYRVPLGQRWAVVAFGSAGRVGEHVRGLSPRGIHLAGGGGVRFSVDKRDRINIRLDLAYGDSLRPYLQFREAF